MSENGDDIVARLERLATKMFQSGNWGRDLDTVKEAMDTIVDLRVDLHRIEELEAKLATCEKYRDAYDQMGRIGTEAYRDLEAKLAKAVAALQQLVLEYDEVALAHDEPESMTAAYVVACTTLAELKGEK